MNLLLNKLTVSDIKLLNSGIRLTSNPQKSSGHSDDTTFIYRVTCNAASRAGRVDRPPPLPSRRNDNPLERSLMNRLD